MIFPRRPYSSLLLVVAAISRATLGSSSLIQELVNSKVNDQDLATLLNQQDEESSSLFKVPANYFRGKPSAERGLERRERMFGDRCGNRNDCSDGLDCTGVDIGNRCLPNTCLQSMLSNTTSRGSNMKSFHDTFDIENFKTKLYDSAGYSEEEILGALLELKNEQLYFFFII